MTTTKQHDNLNPVQLDDPRLIALTTVYTHWLATCLGLRLLIDDLTKTHTTRDLAAACNTTPREFNLFLERIKPAMTLLPDNIFDIDTLFALNDELHAKAEAFKLTLGRGNGSPGEWRAVECIEKACYDIHGAAGWLWKDTQ